MCLDATARIRRHELPQPSSCDIPIDPASEPVFDMMGDARMALDAGFAILEVEYMLDLSDGSIDRMFCPEKREAVLAEPAMRRTA